MIKQVDVLAALDKPRKLFSIQKRVDSSTKSTDVLQELLREMLHDGKLNFDVKTGRWSKT